MTKPVVIFLSILVVIVGVAGLIYTIRVGKTVNEQEQEHDQDTKITAKHPILFNPVFLAYIIGFGGLLVFIFYLTMTRY
ncbi:hypothetical protein [Gracilibacillus timonensis]|uniref:hypothetical protein n=1 Tax=Gracilibacillus timonensis TaxID=1816696 RepID=UPI0010305094|nr:hypothetical protein [Gracilibacillus timonensis]